MSLLNDKRFYRWGEKFLKNGERTILDAAALIPVDETIWATAFRKGLEEQKPILEIFTVTNPAVVNIATSVQESLKKIPEITRFLSSVQSLYFGYATNDIKKSTPLMCLSFENEDTFLISSGPAVVSDRLPPILRGLVAVTGGWIDIGMAPLSNFDWFLEPSRMKDNGIPDLYVSLYEQTTNNRKGILSGLKAGIWPQPEDCILIGEVANGDELIYVIKGHYQGKIFLVSHDIPGILNQHNNNHVEWLRWLFQSANCCIQGKDCTLPDYF